MRPSSMKATLALGAVAIALGGCEPIGMGPRLPPGPVVMPPQVPAYVLEDVIGGRAARVRKARAAGLAPLPAADAYSYVNKQELDLRRQTAGTGVEVFRSGELLLVRLPATFAFDVGKAEIKPQAISVLGEVAWTLKRYNRTLVDVLGHTDSTGSAAANQALSQRRAQAVSAYLSSHGTRAARIATKGYGATRPIADNATETGRALNRRVEIRIVPLR